MHNMRYGTGIIRHADIIVACRGYYTKNSRKYPVKSAYGYVCRYAD